MTEFNNLAAELSEEIKLLQARLSIAEDTLQAIHQGTVDAFVIATPEGDQVFTLQSADYTYRLLIEQMCEGAVIFTSDGWILYANKAFANLLNYSLDKVISSPFHKFVLQEDVNIFQNLIQKQTQELSATAELSLVKSNQQKISVDLSANKFNIDNHYINCIIVTDLTEKKQNEEILASERFARSILEQVADSMVVCNKQGKIIRVSQVFQNLCRQNCLFQDFDDVLSLFYSKLDIRILPIDPKIIIENRFYINSVLEGKDYHGVELYYERADGEYFDFLLNACPLLNSIGEITGAIINLTNITERKCQEAQLQQAKLELEVRVAQRTNELANLNKSLVYTVNELERNQKNLWEKSQLLDLAHDTILTQDLNSVITFWNHGGEEMYGWTKAEAIEKVVHVLLQTQFPIPLSEIHAQLINQGYWQGELIHIAKNGTSVTVASRWVIQKDELGNPIKILEINNNITQQKQQEIDLQDSESKFRSLSECLPIGIFLTNIQGECIYVNPCFQKIFDIKMAEVIGKNWLEIIHAENEENLSSLWLRILTDYQENFSHEIRYSHKDGKIHYAQIRLAPMLINGVQLSGYIGTVEDVTEIRAVAQIKRDFISIVSHELRTPLTAIHGSLGLLAGKVYDKNPEKQSQMINIAASQTERLVRLVNDILVLEKLESGKTVIVKQACDAAQLIRDSADTMQAKAEKYNISFNIQSLSLQVWANSDSIIQILTNLLSNGIKFSPPNSTISISNTLVDTVETQSQIFSHVSNHSVFDSLIPPYILFQVKDQGTGIPADQLESIFGWFQQVDASNAREKSGTGLGLAICQSIIQKHEGQIWVESKLGQGSTFFFTLPLYIAGNR